LPVKTTSRETGSASDPDDGAPQEHPHRNPIVQFLSELPGLIIMALLLAIVIKTFLFQAFFIPTGSMEPTLMPGDRVLVNKVPYYFGDPGRGDIIVFENPNGSQGPDRSIVGGFFHWLGEGLGVSGQCDPDQPESGCETDYIKRVVGLPGDTVEGIKGSVYVNGSKLSEPYLDGVRTAPFAEHTVPEGYLFVMGDNRGNSLDSRFSLGDVPIGNVIGKAFVIMWPPGRAGLLH
jgi:signal peptidase I